MFPYNLDKDNNSKYFPKINIFYGNKKIKIKKSRERKNILWSQRYFFRESFFTFLKLDNYKCPFFKFTKNFPEKSKSTKSTKTIDFLSIEINNISKQLKENPFQPLLLWIPF